MTRPLLLSLLCVTTAQAEWKAGAARQNITPNYPVMLSGYGGRTEEAKEVKVEIWAKALALAWDDEPPAVIVSVDSCAVPASMRTEVLAALKDSGVEDARLNICSSHTHCAPALTTSLKNLFGIELDATKVEHVERYTRELRDYLISASKAAIKAMEPAKVEHVVTSVDFAKNRRLISKDGIENSINPDGPVDHAVPVLKISDTKGDIRAVFASYACHCTTMGWNYIHPDWAGLAQLHVEMAFPKAICLTAIGCGGDQNPQPRREEQWVRIHGFELGRVVRWACAKPMREISGPLQGGLKHLELPFATAPEKAELEKNAQSKSRQIARHASFILDRIANGKPQSDPLPYTVQTLTFGDQLAMVFLNGEVVVDYSLRLKRELDKERLWVNAYANDVQGYIPSERVLKEGGYEGGGAMVHYLQQGPFAPGLEDKIVGAVKELLPGFLAR